MTQNDSNYSSHARGGLSIITYMVIAFAIATVFGICFITTSIVSIFHELELNRWLKDYASAQPDIKIDNPKPAYGYIAMVVAVIVFFLVGWLLIYRTKKHNVPPVKVFYLTLSIIYLILSIFLLIHGFVHNDKAPVSDDLIKKYPAETQPISDHYWHHYHNKFITLRWVYVVAFIIQTIAWYFTYIFAKRRNLEVANQHGSFLA